MKNRFDLRKFLTENKINENLEPSAEELADKIGPELDETLLEEFLEKGAKLIRNHISDIHPEERSYIHQVATHLANVLVDHYESTYLNEEEEDEIRDTDDDFHPNPLQDRINKLKDGEDVEESAPGYNHDCAAHVVHETYGYGICLEGRHTLVETSKGRAKVTHYDVFFKNGSKIVENIPVEDLVIESIEEHHHGKRKK